MLSELFCLEATSLVSVTQAKNHSPSSNTPHLQYAAPLSMTGRDEWGVEGHFLPPHFKLQQFKTNRAPTGGFRNDLTAPPLSKSDRIPSEHCAPQPFISAAWWACEPKVCNPYHFRKYYAVLLSLKCTFCSLTGVF